MIGLNNTALLCLVTHSLEEIYFTNIKVYKNVFYEELTQCVLSELGFLICHLPGFLQLVHVVLQKLSKYFI